MIAALIGIAFVCGLFGGVVAYDFRAREKDKVARQDQDKVHREMMEGFAKAHNGLTQQIADMATRLTGLEMSKVNLNGPRMRNG